MSIVQIVLVSFLFFALSRVVLQYRHGQIKFNELAFWSIIFSAAIAGVIDPAQTTKIARSLGIGRGADLVLYASIAVLYYLVFRIYIFLENIHHEITDLVRKIAIHEYFHKKKKKK